MKVLIVEDERLLANFLATGLRRDGLVVDVAYDGAAGQERLELDDYDVVVLDRRLPRIHGDELCRSLVARGERSRVLMLSAAGQLDDRVDGLELGADDYLSKPFEYPELLARIRALGRRAPMALPPILRSRGLMLDPARRTVTREGRVLSLTPKEFAVLEVLMRAQGSIVSTEQLLRRAWDEHADPFTGAVRVALSKLRSKLGDPPLIETVNGAGYRI